MVTISQDEFECCTKTEDQGEIWDATGKLGHRRETFVISGRAREESRK